MGGRAFLVQDHAMEMIGHDRIDHPAVGQYFLFHKGIAIVGSAQKSAELGFRVINDQGKQILALVLHKQRLVVGDQVSEQAYQENHADNPKTCDGRAVGQEMPPAPVVHLGHGEKAKDLWP